MGQAMSAREQEPDAHRWPGVALSIQVLLGSCLGCCPNLDAWQEETCKGHRTHGRTRDTFLGRVAGRKALHAQRTTHSGNAGAHPALHSRPHPLWTVELLASAFR